MSESILIIGLCDSSLLLSEQIVWIRSTVIFVDIAILSKLILLLAGVYIIGAHVITCHWAAHSYHTECLFLLPVTRHTLRVMVLSVQLGQVSWHTLNVYKVIASCCHIGRAMLANTRWTRLRCWAGVESITILLSPWVHFVAATNRVCRSTLRLITVNLVTLSTEKWLKLIWQLLLVVIVLASRHVTSRWQVGHR